jgi:hypothetical protein
MTRSTTRCGPVAQRELHKMFRELHNPCRDPVHGGWTGSRRQACYAVSGWPGSLASDCREMRFSISSFGRQVKYAHA